MLSFLSFLYGRRQYIKFVISGTLAWLTELAVIIVLTEMFGVWYALSAGFAVAAAFSVSFFLQKFWTFRHDCRKRIIREALLYLLVLIVNFSLNFLFIHLLVEWSRQWLEFHYDYVLAQALIGSLIGIGNFLFYKFAIFSDPAGAADCRRPVRLLLATGIYPPDIGGPATMLGALAGRLEKDGYQVKILTFADQGQSGQKVRRIKRGSAWGHVYYFLAMWRLARKSDLIYVTDIYSVGYFAYLIKLITGRPYIVRFAGDSAWEKAVNSGWTNDYIVDFQTKKYGRKIEKAKARRREIMKLADAVIAVSYFLGEIAAMIGVDQTKIKVIYNSVDFAEEVDHSAEAVSRIKAKLEIAGQLIVTACRLTPWKGVDGLIRMMARLIPDFPDLKLLILGDGPEEATLKKLAQETGVAPATIFLGRVPQSQVGGYMAASDLFILNSNYEGLSHTLLEAMKIGVPVMASRSGGNPETFEHEISGILVDYNDVEQLVAGAKRILADAEFNEKLVKNGQENLKKFNWDNTIKQTEVLIDEIYEKNSSNKSGF